MSDPVTRDDVIKLATAVDYQRTVVRRLEIKLRDEKRRLTGLEDQLQQVIVAARGS